MEAFHEYVKELRKPPKRVLEVGGLVGRDSLLNFPELAGADRYVVNLVEMEPQDGITVIQGDGNDLSMFPAGWFDLIMCNATLEHDKYFWLTLAEMKRVLKARGTLMIGVPGFQLSDSDVGDVTTTFRVHMKWDYYRFSEQTVREVFFEGLVGVKVRPIMEPVRMIGRARKPPPATRPGTKKSLRLRIKRRVRRRLALLAEKL